MQIYIVSEEQYEIYSKALPDDIGEKLLDDELILIGAVDEEDNSICGALACDVTGSEWEIVYIYVKEDRRREEIASSMLILLDVTAMGLLAERVIVTYTKREDKDIDLDYFFEAMLCDISSKNEVYKVEVKTLGEKLLKMVKSSSNTSVVPLSSVSGRRWNMLRNRIVEKGSNYTDPEDETSQIYMDPVDMDLYDKDCSFLYIDKDDTSAGCILISKKEQGVLLDYLCMLEEGVSAQKALMHLFVSAFKAVEDKFGEDTQLFANTQNKTSKELLSKIADGAEELYAMSIERIVQ